LHRQQPQALAPGTFQALSAIRGRALTRSLRQVCETHV
jgi:hypothetical protein